jgi:hypothetical protein
MRPNGYILPNLVTLVASSTRVYLWNEHPIAIYRIDVCATCDADADNLIKSRQEVCQLRRRQKGMFFSRQLRSSVEIEI